MNIESWSLKSKMKIENVSKKLKIEYWKSKLKIRNWKSETGNQIGKFKLKIDNRK